VARPGTARYARGAQRRDSLIEAAAAVLVEQGIAALSHRAVAARAGLPLAATTYYFASADDLRDESLRHVTDTWLTQATAVVEAAPARLDAAQAARAVVAAITGDAPREQLLLVYERYLEAGRHERLRPLVAESNARLVDLVRELLRRADLPADPAEARLVLAVTDGAIVTALAEGEPPVDAAVTTLDRLLQAR
jgi:DNA-binding transcriptional regulator YbjK